MVEAYGWSYICTIFLWNIELNFFYNIDEKKDTYPGFMEDKKTFILGWLYLKKGGKLMDTE